MQRTRPMMLLFVAVGCGEEPFLDVLMDEARYGGHELEVTVTETADGVPVFSWDGGNAHDLEVWSCLDDECFCSRIDESRGLFVGNSHNEWLLGLGWLARDEQGIVGEPMLESPIAYGDEIEGQVGLEPEPLQPGSTYGVQVTIYEEYREDRSRLEVEERGCALFVFDG